MKHGYNAETYKTQNQDNRNYKQLIHNRLTTISEKPVNNTGFSKILKTFCNYSPQLSHRFTDY